MKTKPAIALLRQQAATAKFEGKLEVLKNLLENGGLDRFPRRASIAMFASWEDPELGIHPISRSIIYGTTDEYLTLRRQMEHLLERVEQARARVEKRANVESDLRRKLELAEAKAQEFVNQYSSARAELLDAQEEIKRLRAKLRRQILEEGRVVRLVPNSTEPRRTE